MFWRHETSRKLLRAQLTRPLLRTRAIVTAGLGWDTIQVVRSLGNSTVSGTGGGRGWVIASLYLLESSSPLNESHCPPLETVRCLSMK